jgi:hypothetical protein
MAGDPQNNQNTPDPALYTADQLGGSSGQTDITTQLTQQQLIAQALQNDPTLAINGVLGGLPVAEKNQEYIAIIKEAGSTAPEIIDKTQFFISYLCDSDFNISKPSEDTIALSNLTQNFETQKFARVRVDQGTVLNPQLAGLHKISHIGSIEPILLTQVNKGPLAYVTTMSFVQDGELDGIPGALVADYHVYYDMHGGFRTSLFSSGSHPNLPAGIINTTGSTQAFQPYQTIEDTPSGSAVTISQSKDYFTFGPDGGYYDVAKFNSSSFEGKSRIRIQGHVGISLATSSIHDIYLTLDPPPTMDPKGYNYSIPVTCQLVRKRGGVESMIVQDTRNLNIFNPTANTLYDNGVQFNFSDELMASVANAAFIQLSSPFISVEENDEYFFRVKPPQEPSSSIGMSNSWPLWDQLLSAVPKYSYRTYKYFSGYFGIYNETPSGDNVFINGITGVTASYVDGATGLNTFFNSTGSYFVGYNNTTDGAGENVCFLTCSSYLSQFYGGNFTQVNPGTEAYNNVNANGSESSSLYITDEETGKTTKETSINFGFNPIRLPFIPIPGDYIRFEYRKENVFQITKANTLAGTLILKIKGHLEPGIVVDNFLIYRILNNGQNLILDVNKNLEAGVDQAFTGIITAEYPSSGITSRGDELIFDLKQANILEN